MDIFTTIAPILAFFILNVQLPNSTEINDNATNVIVESGSTHSNSTNAKNGQLQDVSIIFIGNPHSHDHPKRKFFTSIMDFSQFYKKFSPVPNEKFEIYIDEYSLPSHWYSPELIKEFFSIIKSRPDLMNFSSVYIDRKWVKDVDLSGIDNVIVQ